MARKLLTGSFVALITPFNRDGSVDFAAFRSLLTFHEDHGTSAVLIMGSTGETSLLAPEEKKAIIVECAKMKTASGLRNPSYCPAATHMAKIAVKRFSGFRKLPKPTWKHCLRLAVRFLPRSAINLS